MRTYSLPDNIRLTPLARAHMRQWGIKSDQVACCLDHGQQQQRDRVIIYTLRRADIPPEDRARFERAAGLVVIRVAATSRILAVYHLRHQKHRVGFTRTTWRKAVA